MRAAPEASANQPEVIVTDPENRNYRIHPEIPLEGPLEPPLVVAMPKSPSKSNGVVKYWEMMRMTFFNKVDAPDCTSSSPVLPLYCYHDVKNLSEEAHEQSSRESIKPKWLASTLLLPLLITVGCFLVYNLPSKPMALDSMILAKSVKMYDIIVDSLGSDGQEHLHRSASASMLNSKEDLWSDWLSDNQIDISIASWESETKPSQDLEWPPADGRPAPLADILIDDSILSYLPMQ